MTFSKPGTEEALDEVFDLAEMMCYESSYEDVREEMLEWLKEVRRSTTVRPTEKIRRKCALCHERGHNRLTCKKKPRLRVAP